MILPHSLIIAAFIDRANRFVCRVEVNGREEKAHLPNSGRLRELLSPGRRVYLVETASPARRTRYDMLLADIDGLLVSLDARLPNDLVDEALLKRTLAPFREYDTVRREITYGDSRFDFMLQRGGQLCYVEVKSITLVEGGRGLFPDAPTLRGRRHVEGLVQARQEGHGAAAVFVIQRPDAASFSPNDATDPDFGRALREARQAGVGVYAYRCRVSLKEIAIEDEVPVDM